MKKHMHKPVLYLIIFSLFLVSCGSTTSKKRSLDHILFKYASIIRWSDYDSAVSFLKPDIAEIIPSQFELDHLKQFKVSRYTESPIRPGNDETSVIQDVEIELYNIHTNNTKVIYDHQIWEFDGERKLWALTSGLPKL